MDKIVSASEANRKFSQMLRSVREGDSYVVTSHGRPIARLLPVKEDRNRSSAKSRLLKRLQSQPAHDIGPWTREELYEE
jgi:prevent-host-death family protein